ncbi:MAG: gamma carbonic anhydrase family protein [Erysipelotrichaceae bacterium]|nr:gamma carbonic anhydrase family protein [Erysipelotrichaceae bacterium]MBQ1512284.1 gamma carbonic anhydrase family protein [Erysipelotrichaceae bacterium]MBQ1809998.1 gamma carbonic anhydrase family protein [Erysipelotrichaceae bacterium]MBQ5756751.1 gamma carbonic anhydrase family protein [Erysipelotrichaceae bacterium]
MSTWIASDAVIFGDVTFGEDCSVYYHCVVRTEEGKIVFGKETNLQDNCIVHNEKEYPVIVGDRVTVGHGCILHGCQIGDDSLIGMGSILMNGCKIGKNCLIGAGSLVSGGTVIPDGSVAYGRPAKVIRLIREEEIAMIKNEADYYLKIKPLHEENDQK